MIKNIGNEYRITMKKFFTILVVAVALLLAAGAWLGKKADESGFFKMKDSTSEKQESKERSALVVIAQNGIVQEMDFTVGDIDDTDVTGLLYILGQIKGEWAVSNFSEQETEESVTVSIDQVEGDQRISVVLKDLDKKDRKLLNKVLHQIKDGKSIISVSTE